MSVLIFAPVGLSPYGQEKLLETLREEYVHVNAYAFLGFPPGTGAGEGDKLIGQKLLLDASVLPRMMRTFGWNGTAVYLPPAYGESIIPFVEKEIHTGMTPATDQPSLEDILLIPGVHLSSERKKEFEDILADIERKAGEVAEIKKRVEEQGENPLLALLPQALLTDLLKNVLRTSPFTNASLYVVDTLESFPSSIKIGGLGEITFRLAFNTPSGWTPFDEKSGWYKLTMSDPTGRVERTVHLITSTAIERIIAERKPRLIVSEHDIPFLASPNNMSNIRVMKESDLLEGIITPSGPRHAFLVEDGQMRRVEILPSHPYEEYEKIMPLTQPIKS